MYIPMCEFDFLIKHLLSKEIKEIEMLLKKIRKTSIMFMTNLAF